jgi:hypothetical protein
MTSNYDRAAALAKNAELIMAEGRIVYAGSLALGQLFATLALTDEVRQLREGLRFAADELEFIPPKDAP